MADQNAPNRQSNMPVRPISLFIALSAVVNTAQTWATFKQLYFPEEFKPDQSNTMFRIVLLVLYNFDYWTSGWFGLLWEIQLFE